MYNRLNDIGNDVGREELPRQLLSVSDMAALARSGRYFYGLLQPKLEAARLLQCVIDADWDAIEKFMTHAPSRMLEHTKGRDINGRMIWISPLKYAFYVHDDRAQQCFITKAIEGGWYAQLREQVAGLTHYFDFTPFLKAYASHLTVVRQWHFGLVTKKYVDQCWYERVGGVQRDCLPRHLLKRFSVKDLTEQTPKTCRAFDVVNSQYLNVLALDSANLALGENYALYQGFGSELEIERDGARYIGIRTDYDLFKNLIQATQAQQAERNNDLNLLALTKTPIRITL